MNTIIIGAGAAGLTAAIIIKRKYGCPVTVLEKNPKAGKKLLLTGNGRCNIANSFFSAGGMYGDAEIIRNVCDAYSLENDTEFLRSLGLELADDGSPRLYPRSMQASSVVSCFYRECENLGVGFVFGTPVTDISRKDGGYVVNGEYSCDRLVLAGGGLAAPKTGSDGSLFGLLEKHGVRHTPLYPALCGLNTGKDYPYCLKGVRAQCSVTLVSGGREAASDAGEVQFNEKSVSGIPVMQLTAACPAPAEGAYLLVNKIPFMTADEIRSYIDERIKKNPSLPAEEILTGLVNPKLYHDDLKTLGIKPDAPSAALNGKTATFIRLLTEMRINVTGTAGFDNAQTTAGGIPHGELAAGTTELKKLPRVYVAGEMLDAHGICGGYNLTFARQSAYMLEL